MCWFRYDDRAKRPPSWPPLRKCARGAWMPTPEVCPCSGDGATFQLRRRNPPAMEPSSALPLLPPGRASSERALMDPIRISLSPIPSIHSSVTEEAAPSKPLRAAVVSRDSNAVAGCFMRVCRPTRCTRRGIRRWMCSTTCAISTNAVGPVCVWRCCSRLRATDQTTHVATLVSSCQGTVHASAATYFRMMTIQVIEGPGYASTARV
jgi:hypothetical protein